ncbi:MAG: fibronectin type III domain-containing protein [Bacteroidetes bacterium]|nr:fibronectin type III domain-containing protein [Bacteroidota bacterium]
MGHLIGSRHTHACVWNGNSTAIDGCAGYVEGSCALPGNPSSGGTIMSYCHLTSVGMNLSLGFGPQPGNVIRNTVLNATCLHNCGYSSCTDGFMNGQETGVDCGGPSCPVCPATCTTPSGVTVTSISVNSAVISWTGVIGAVTYALDYKLNSSSTWTVASAAIANGTSFYLTGLTGGSLYDFRLRTNCASGNSSYYQSQFTTLTPAACNSNYEPNESTAAAATIPANTTITATIGTTSDLDYYKLTTTVTSDFNVNLTNLAGDYDLQMFNSAGTSIGLSENPYTTSENITLTSLAAGTYYFFVYGYGGANSPTVCYNLNVGVSTAAGCIAPTGLTASAITSTTATVSWSAVGAALSYNVEYKLNSSPTWILATSTNTTLSVNLSGLIVGSLYDYRVSANCTGGLGPYAQAQFTTSPACITAFEPNESQAAAVTISANTTVSAGIYASGDLDYFKVTTSVVTNFNVTLTGLPADFDIQMLNSGGTVLVTSQNGGTTSETITLTNQAAGTYTFKVYGYAGANSASVCYNLFVGTTSAVTCDVPGTLSTSAITTSSATFNWGAVAGATGYNIQYRLIGASSWTSANSATNSYSVSSLSPNSNYEWQVQTICTSGLSAFSSSVLFTTVCATPSVTITASGPTTLCPGGSVTLTVNPSLPVNNYQWLLNGSNILGATSSTYTLSSAGNYSVQVTAGTCSSTSAVTTISSAGLPTITSFTPTSAIVGTNVTITGTNFVNVSDVRFNTTSASFIVNSATSITATVPAGATTGLLSVITACGTVNSASNFTVVTNYTILAKVYIEGFYIGGGLMRAVVNPVATPSLCDTVEIQLARGTSPYTIDYSDKVVIGTNGIGNFHFPTSVIGQSYYLVVRHRNSLQTWSANPITFSGFTMVYDFTTSAAKAYGNNQMIQADGKRAFIAEISIRTILSIQLIFMQ